VNWIAPILRTDDKRTGKYYLKQVPETIHPHAYTSVTDPGRATVFLTKEAAEAAQAQAKADREALPKVPDWADDFTWPTLAFPPVEQIQ